MAGEFSAYRPRQYQLFDQLGMDYPLDMGPSRYDMDMEFGIPSPNDNMIFGNNIDQGLRDFNFGDTPNGPMDSIRDNASLVSGNQTTNPLENIGAAGRAPNITPQGFSMEDWMKQFQPEHEASDRYNQLIGQYPQDTRPGWGRAITAAAMAARDPQAAFQFLDRPRTQAIEDWSKQIVPAGQAANYERQENINARTARYQEGQLKLGQQRVDETAQKNRNTDEYNRKRNALLEFKALNPEVTKWDTEGPTYKYLDPKTNQMVDTGVPTGKSTDIEEITLRGKLAMERVIEGERQARLTKETPSADAGVTSILPTQKRVQAYNEAKKLYDALGPEFIELGEPGTNTFEIVRPGTDMWGRRTGPTPEQYREMYKRIHGEDAPPEGQVITPKPQTYEARPEYSTGGLSIKPSTTPNNDGGTLKFSPVGTPENPMRTTATAEEKAVPTGQITEQQAQFRLQQDPGIRERAKAEAAKRGKVLTEADIIRGIIAGALR